MMRVPRTSREPHDLLQMGLVAAIGGRVGGLGSRTCVCAREYGAVGWGKCD